MALRCICIIVLAIGAASGTPKKATAENKEKINRIGGDRIAALYVKDGESGDLRFLAGNNGNSALNQFITQTQDVLEQLRPNTGNGNFGFGTTNAGALGTLGTLGSFGTAGTIGSTGTNGINPIIVNLGNTGATNSNNNGLQGINSGPSPIGGLLPQVIAQAVLNQRRNQIRNGNRRRVVNNNRRPGNAQRQVYVIRPNA